MKEKPPPDRHAFDNVWDEINYLRVKLLYWLYRRHDRARSRAFAERLARLLTKADPDQASILGQECRSLVHEALGDLPRAIAHRENEIRFIRRLHEISIGTLTEATALDGYDFSDLSDRLDLLAVLYHDSGQLDKAIQTLKESRQVCAENGVKFDGAELLREYQEESRVARKRAPASVSRQTSKR
ncbi:MAG TPA: hypothetical protein VKD71_12280 [Gemmataceae bacterium]|nr:hypothetical protein [Gemmataceae bacterium]